MRADSGMVMATSRSPQVTFMFSRSMVSSASGFSEACFMRVSTSSCEAQTQGMPKVVELPKKISAKDSAITARNPLR